MSAQQAVSEDDEPCECGRELSECAIAEGSGYHLDRDQFIEAGVPNWMLTEDEE